MDESLCRKVIPSADLSNHEPEYPSYTQRGIPSTSGKTDEVWINQMMDHIKSACHVDHLDCPCTIFKVPEHIRQLDPKAYDPIVASFGPFHHRYDCSVTQEHKWRYVWHLLSRHGSEERANQLLKECLMELKKRDNMVRHCYYPELPQELDAHNLASIMLLDGCFIIYLMLKMHARKKGMDEETEEDESKKRREWNIEMGEDGRVLSVRKGHEQLESPHEAEQSTFNIVVYDVLKLENQIPFFIIQLLFDHLKPCEDKEIDLVDLALQLFKGIHPKESKSFKQQKKKDPSKYHHLLHLFYLSRIHSKKPVEPTSAATWIHCAIECVKSRWKLSKKKSEWKKAGATSSLRNWPSTPRWTPNAVELDRVGVKFKRKERADGFLNITFKQKSLLRLSWFCLMFKSGWMEIPPLQIYDYTSHLFRNLMAFEQCYPKTEMDIMTYVFFMDGIIDQAEDVRLLRLEGILQHKQSNDEAAAELFNKLGSQIQFDWKSNYLEKEITEVIYRVDKFYEFKWHEWLAGLKRDYFGNPWTIISVLAGTAILVLTVEQATFSAMSYFHSS